MGLPVLHGIAELRRQIGQWREAGDGVGLVPTMGALHAGHLALVRAALGQHPRAVVSIFVNPTQFGPGEDFELYPRQPEADAALLADAGVSALYLPRVEEMYPDGFATQIQVGGPISQVLDAVHRPGHFTAVATVVCKLLMQALPDSAYFGEKDYQQLQLVRRMARDLDLPVAIRAVPTVREADGLALSSRNAYLSDAERATAAMLPRILQDAAVQIGAGAAVDPVLASARARLQRAGIAAIDYLELCDATSLLALRRADRPCRLLAAVRVGRTRLIDNFAVESR